LLLPIFSLVSEVEFAAIVDKRDGIDRAKSNPIPLLGLKGKKN
jgi:hypothetical protein